MNTDGSSLHLPALSEAELDVLGAQVFCDDEIGLTWQPIAQLPGERAMKSRDWQNEKILRALALVEEHEETQSDVAERAELHRLEGKLDLMLELVNVLVRESRGGAASRAARFNARGLCWDAQEPVAAGTLLDVDCYLLAQWPLPLKLCVHVIESSRSGSGFRVCTRIQGLGIGSRDWLGKLVFRRHRRSIALRRSRS
jgi:hypothetical protein